MKSRRNERTSEMLTRLGEGGLKLTPQRVAIVGELAGDLTHPTAQELYERLLPSMPTMSFATVYNTLDALARHKLIEARTLAPGPTRFDPNVEPHHHAVCEHCGLVVDVAAHARAGGGDVADGGLPAGFAVRTVEQVFRGVCHDCSHEVSAVNPRRTPAAR